MGIEIALDKWWREVAQVGVRFVERALGQAADIRDVDPVVGLQCKLRAHFKLAIDRAPVSCKNKSVLSLNNFRGEGDQPLSDRSSDRLVPLRWALASAYGGWAIASSRRPIRVVTMRVRFVDQSNPAHHLFQLESSKRD